jgi:hypothetical protein
LADIWDGLGGIKTIVSGMGHGMALVPKCAIPIIICMTVAITIIIIIIKIITITITKEIPQIGQD